MGMLLSLKIEFSVRKAVGKAVRDVSSETPGVLIVSFLMLRRDFRQGEAAGEEAAEIPEHAEDIDC